MNEDEEKVLRKWSVCKTCEHRTSEPNGNRKKGFYSYCWFWGNQLTKIKWCNK